jgi:hypothetical protein
MKLPSQNLVLGVSFLVGLGMGVGFLFHEAPAAPTNSICAPAQLETLLASVPFRTFDRAPQHANVPFFTPTDLSDSKLLSSWHCLAPRLAGT